MRLRLPKALALIAAALLIAGCDDDPTGIQGPFTFRILIQVGGASRDLLVPGEDIEVEVGQRLLMNVQVLDARGVPPAIQTETVGETTNPRVLESTGATFDDEQDLARFTFRAREAGVSALGFVNPRAQLQTTILVRVEEPE